MDYGRIGHSCACHGPLTIIEIALWKSTSWVKSRISYPKTCYDLHWGMRMVRNLLMRGSCHCQKVEFEVSLPNGLDSFVRCNCSMCARRGAVVSPVPVSAMSIVKGEKYLKLYQFHTKTAEHFFCENCGIYTHHRRRSDPGIYSINVACLEGVNPFELGEIEVTDGLNHSKDS